MTLKDSEKIKNWFYYRNRKMKHLINQAEMNKSVPSIVNVKPVPSFFPSFNSDIYLNIVNKIYANNVMILYNSLFQNAYLAKAYYNLYFAVKRDI